MSVQEPSRRTYVDVTLTADAGALVTIATSTTHPLCPNGVIVGPLSLKVDPDSNITEPFGSQMLDRVDTGLIRMGYFRPGDWHDREQGFVAWVDPSREPLPDPCSMFVQVEAGVLP